MRTTTEQYQHKSVTDRKLENSNNDVSKLAYINDNDQHMPNLSNFTSWRQKVRSCGESEASGFCIFAAGITATGLCCLRVMMMMMMMMMMILQRVTAASNQALHWTCHEGRVNWQLQCIVTDINNINTNTVKPRIEAGSCINAGSRIQAGDCHCLAYYLSVKSSKHESMTSFIR